MVLRRAVRDLPTARHAERLGKPTGPVERGMTWVNAASVGELQAVLPLLPDLGNCLVTTHTHTAAAIAEDAGCRHQFTPIDSPRAVTTFLNTWAPNRAVFVEAEMPPRLIRALAARRVPLALVAARPSKTRARVPRTAARLLGTCQVMTAASDEVAQELAGLGLRVNAVEDLKASAPTIPIAPNLRAKWAPIAKRPAWIAASTHEGEDAAILAAHQKLRKTHPNALLILAPRHPGRAEALCALAKAQFGLPASRQSVEDNPTVAPVHVVDTMGELPVFHEMTAVTFLGGSFVDVGGHSPYEAARYGTHILTGSGIANHAPGYAEIPHRITTPATLAQDVLACLEMPRPAPLAPRPPSATLAALAKAGFTKT